MNDFSNRPLYIAICDDEKEIREMLKEKIMQIYPKAILLSYSTGEELLSEDGEWNILLLDINMAGKNGMEVARELRKKHKDTILIFVTALEEYVFEAFDVGAFHYLVKPFEDDKFKEVLQKAVGQYYNNSEYYQKESKKQYIMVYAKGVHTKIALDDIVYAEVFNRKIMIHTHNEKIEYYGRLSELEKQLGEDFFRPHRGYLIHFKYVEKYDASTIYMGKGQALMAKQNYPEFVRRYLKYNKRKGSVLL